MDDKLKKFEELSKEYDNAWVLIILMLFLGISDNEFRSSINKLGGENNVQ